MVPVLVAVALLLLIKAAHPPPDPGDPAREPVVGSAAPDHRPPVPPEPDIVRHSVFKLPPKPESLLIQYCVPNPLPPIEFHKIDSIYVYSLDVDVPNKLLHLD